MCPAPRRLSKQRGAELRAGAASHPCYIPECWAELRAASPAGLGCSWVAPAALAPSDSHGTAWGKVLPMVPALRGCAAQAGEQLPCLAPLCPAAAQRCTPTVWVSMSLPGRILSLLSPTLPHLCPRVGPAWMPAVSMAQHGQGLLGAVTTLTSGGRDCTEPCVPSTTQSGHPTGAGQPPLLQHPLSPPASGLLPAHYQDLGPAGSMCGANPAPAGVPGPCGTDGQEGGCTRADQVGLEQSKASKWFCPSP